MLNTETETEKKPRHVRSLQERMADLATETRRVNILQAQEYLNEIDGLRDAKGAMKFHDRYLTEGEALLDNDKYSARLANLQQRMSALESKRTIAEKDVERRRAAKDRFENALSSIGAAIQKAIDGGKTVTKDELFSIFEKNVSEDDMSFLNDVSDPYANYRRAKKVKSTEPAMDETTDETTDED